MEPAPVDADALVKALQSSHPAELAAALRMARQTPGALRDARVMRAYVAALVDMFRNRAADAGASNFAVLGVADLLAAPVDAVASVVADELLHVDRADVERHMERAVLQAVRGAQDLQ